MGKNFFYGSLGLRVSCLRAKVEGGEFTRTSLLLEGSEGERALEHIHVMVT